MTLSLTPSQLPGELTDIVRAGLVPNILGSPGIAKSDCVYQFAKANNLFMYNFSLSNREPVDMSGYPMLNQSTNRMMFAAPEELPLSTDPIPKGKSGFVVFLDEANACSRATAAAAYRLILDRKVGRHSLHPATAMIAAGNLKTDKAIVNDLGTAMKSRMVNIRLSVSNDDWLAWANKSNIDQRVISFIKFRAPLLHRFEPNKDDYNFPCPRTWHFLSKYITDKKKFSGTNLVSMAGCVGEGAAVEFKAFCKIYNQLPTIENIIEDPKAYKFKDKPDYYFALTTLISTNFEMDPKALVMAMERFPIEFQVITLREAITRNESIINMPEVMDWMSSHSEKLF